MPRIANLAFHQFRDNKNIRKTINLYIYSIDDRCIKLTSILYYRTRLALAKSFQFDSYYCHKNGVHYLEFSQGGIFGVERRKQSVDGHIPQIIHTNVL